VGDAATKENLVGALRGRSPAIVYSASHGIGAPGESLSFQKEINGAICCMGGIEDQYKTWTFSGEDVPRDEPFLEGSVFFQFACFSYGTPAESDFNHWLGEEGVNAEADFVANLPKKLLSHPHGPIAFIGHVDAAWLHGFYDPDIPEIQNRWHPRLAPFVKALETLLQTQPSGLAMAYTNEKFNVTNMALSSIMDGIQRGTISDTPEFEQRLVDTFITRSDAQNYMIFGDPAARLRISMD
jgi:hypothetical protein